MSMNLNHREQYEPSPPSEGAGASGLAWLTVVLGVSSWFLLPLAGAVAALICGFVERRKIAEGTSCSDGQTLVMVGLVAAGAQLVLTALAIVGGLLFATLYGLGGMVG